VEVKKEGKPAVEKYHNLLKSDSSDYAIEVLKIAGVDMT
jgi:oligoendopeptidase F